MTVRSRVMISWSSLLQAVFFFDFDAFQSPNSPFPIFQTGVGGLSECSEPQLSCHNGSAVPNLCCFNFPGGRFLQTQFWDTNPVTGPPDSWTIHGLWPDRCDGSYDSYCDSARSYENITEILDSFEATKLLKDMRTYWKDYRGNDADLWSHEFDKHGTCISTLEPSCYADYHAQEEVTDYFNTTVKLFKRLPTYQWLKDAGILPSRTYTYAFDEIQDALSSRHGAAVTISCRGRELNQIFYQFYTRGRLQSGDFVPAHPAGSHSSCPRFGIRYLPKNDKSKPRPPHTSTAVPTSIPTSTPFIGQGFLNVLNGGRKDGCIISNGHWYRSGTCATFRARQSDSGGGILISSRKGQCAIDGGSLQCGEPVKEGQVFTKHGDLLTYEGEENWYADDIPRGFRQSEVFAQEHDIAIQISWEGR